MHLIYIFKSSISNIYKRKLNFILTTIVLFISFFMLMTVSNCYFSGVYTKLQLCSKLRGNKYLSVKVYDPNFSDNITDKYIEFYKFLNDEYKNDFGIYFITNQYFYDENRQKSLKVFAVNDTLLEINRVNLGLEMSNKDNFIYLPNSMKGKFNDKSVISSEDKKYKYIVNGFYSDDYKIINSEWQASNELFLSLSDVALITFDWNDVYDLESYEIDYDCFNVFIRYEDENNVAEIKDTIFKCASKYNINLYARTFDETIDLYMKDNVAKIREVRLLMIFCFILALFSMITASISDIISRGKFFSILKVVGISPLDIAGMITVENGIKNVIAFGFSVFFLKRQVSSNDLSFNAFRNYTFPLGFLIMTSLILILSFLQYKNVRKDGLLKSIGENKL